MAKVTNGGSFMASPASAKSTCQRLLKTIVDEQRNFTSNEQNKFNDYYEFLSKEDRKKFDRIIDDMNKSSIFNIQLRNQNQNENRKEEEKRMNNNDLNYELRETIGKNEGLVKLNDLEYRAGVATDNADTTLGTNKKHTTPVNFVQGVVMDAVHDNFLLGMVKVVQSENEQRITVADYMGEMKDLKEMQEIALEDFITAEKQIQLSRKGCATMVSRHLINSANFDVQAHVGKIFSHALAVTLEKLVAKALDADTEVEAAKVQYTGSLLKALVAQLALMPESLRASSAIIMNPQAYQAMLGEEDSVGRNLLDFQFENSLRAKVCGVPVIISEQVQAVYVGSLRDAVAVGVNVRSLEAEQLPRRDAVSFAMNAYVGSCVVLPNAVKKLVVTE